MTRVYVRRSEEDRFFEKIAAGPGCCWIWTGALTERGYGVLHSEIARRAHRWSYIFHKGPIPDGLTLDHLCRVKRCVNPDHLEAVTALENRKRAPGGGRPRKRVVTK